MENELRQALEAVLKEAPTGGFNQYAKSYVEAALHHPYDGSEMEGEELRVQLLYIYSNLTHWRGARAREVKAILKKYSK